MTMVVVTDEAGGWRASASLAQGPGSRHEPSASLARAGTS